MEYKFLLVNRLQSWWAILFFTGASLLLGLLLALLKQYNSFLLAFAVILLVVGTSILFWRILKASQYPATATVLPHKLIVANHYTGLTTGWRFENIAHYRFFPAFRSIATLRLTLKNGDKVKLSARDTGLSSQNTDRFEAMVRDFEAAWRRYQQS